MTDFGHLVTDFLVTISDFSSSGQGSQSESVYIVLTLKIILSFYQIFVCVAYIFVFQNNI